MDNTREPHMFDEPVLSPLEQEVLDEYERLAENMKKVSLCLPYSLSLLRCLSLLVSSSVARACLSSRLTLLTLPSSPRPSTPSAARLAPRFLTASGSWNARPAWCSR